MRPNRIFIAMCVGVAASVSWVPCASAQSRADPADPAAHVSAATYRSLFADYRAIGDETVGDWRAANDEVGRIGGWREYAREAQAPEGTRTAPGRSPSKPAPSATPQGAHGGHSMPGGKP